MKGVAAAIARRRFRTGSQSAPNGDLSSKASQARARGDWTTDLYFRRLLSERNPNSAGAWLQYGHALKEAGFYSHAESSYRKAYSLKPDDAEITTQLGHLAKVRGRLDEAVQLFAAARRLPQADLVGIDTELSILRRADRGRVFQDAPRSEARSGVRVFLSVPSGRIVESDKRAVGGNLASADYSYAFAMRGFLQALEALDIDHAVIRHPEYFSDIRQRSPADINIHLGFYPPENIRLLKGAYNINCCAWEFDRLKTAAEITSYHAFGDPIRMLELADEVWAPAHSAVEAIRASGVTTPVRMVTSPILGEPARRPRKVRHQWSELDAITQNLSDISWQPLAIMPRLQPAANEASQARSASLRSILRTGLSDRPPPILLSIFNVHDMRKNGRAMVEGFLKFSRLHPDAILLLKLSTPSRGFEPVNKLLFEEQMFVAGDMFPPLVSERVWMTDEVLTRDEMDHLFDAASFYVCTSHGEGQNLPLVEAMSRGLVPISVDNTAMADYIRPENAIVIPSHQDVFDRRLTLRYGMYGAQTYYCAADAVQAAMAKAADLSDEAAQALSANAIATVREQFGVAPFEAALTDVIARLSADKKVPS